MVILKLLSIRIQTPIKLILHCKIPYFNNSSILSLTFNLPLMMPRDVVADHSSKNSSYNADTSHCLVHILLMNNIIHRHYWSSNFNIIDLLFLLCHRHWSFFTAAATHFDSTQFLHLTGLQTRKTE